MTTASVSSMTAVKVFGKRHGTKEEKLRRKVHRRPDLYNRFDKVPKAASCLSSITFGRRRQTSRRIRSQASRLENLPAEILQQIFELSDNLDLPLASKALTEKLSSKHLHNALATKLLRPIIGHVHTQASEYDLAVATRLLNSKFVTWDFFRAWLCGQRVSQEVSDTLPENLDWRDTWKSFSPSSQLRPPKKLLRSPFTEGKTAFLSVLIRPAVDIIGDPVYRELAYEGLSKAVHDGHSAATENFLLMGLQCDTELLRTAVVDSGCNKSVVELLLSCRRFPSVRQSLGSESLDLLDPVVWNWADNARSRGDSKGEWLMGLLRKTLSDVEEMRVLNKQYASR